MTEIYLHINARTQPLYEACVRRFRAPRVIDYLSLDVEGAEEMVMRKFPFDTCVLVRCFCALQCVRHPTPCAYDIHQQILHTRTMRV